MKTLAEELLERVKGLEGKKVRVPVRERRMEKGKIMDIISKGNYALIFVVETKYGKYSYTCDDTTKIELLE